MKYRLVVIEGPDGVGKSTFIQHLKDKHPDFVYLREPGGCDYSEQIRSLLKSNPTKETSMLTQLLLFWASRAENMSKVILPSIAQGKIVVTDRFDASSYAYQVGRSPNLEKLFWTLRGECLGNVVPVYLNFYLSTEMAHFRTDSRGDKDHFDSLSEQDRLSIRDFYIKFFDNQDIHSNRVNAGLSKGEMLDEAYEIFQGILKEK